MKQRNVVIVAFLLCAAMVIGIGYAAISTNLKVNGNLYTAPSTLHVHFIKAEPDASATNNFCSTATLDDVNAEGMANAATINTTAMTAPGNTAVAIFTIENHMTDVDAKITEANHTVTMGGQIDSNTFTVTYEFLQADGQTGVEIADDAQSVTKLPAGAQVLLKVTVVLNTSFTSENQNATANLVINYTAEAI